MSKYILNESYALINDINFVHVHSKNKECYIFLKKYCLYCSLKSIKIIGTPLKLVLYFDKHASNNDYVRLNPLKVLHCSRFVKYVLKAIESYYTLTEFGNLSRIQ